MNTCLRKSYKTNIIRLSSLSQEILQSKNSHETPYTPCVVTITTIKT